MKTVFTTKNSKKTVFSIKQVFHNARNLLFVIISIGLLFLSSCEQRINSSQVLVEQMIGKYNGQWFKEISFEQTTSFYKDGDIINTESWYETYQYPGKLLIEYDKFGSGSGQLYRNDSIYLFTNNQLDTAYPLVHSLVVLTMDLYHLDTDFAIKRISDMGFDINKFRTDEFNGKQVYVVGSNEKDDYSSDQFWVDKEKLVVVKMITNTSRGVQVVELDDYRELNGSGLIEQQVRFYVNDELFMTEKYYNIEIPNNNIDTYFEPNFFMSRYAKFRDSDFFKLPEYRITPIGDIVRFFGLLVL